MYAAIVAIAPNGVTPPPCLVNGSSRSQASRAWSEVRMSWPQPSPGMFQPFDADVPPIVHGDWSAASGYAAAKEVLAHDGVTAIFVGNDAMALGTLHAMHELGLRCPDDVSLVGFDDYPEAAFFSPGLTTIRQDFDEIGRLSVALLLDLVEKNTSSTQHLVLEPQLVVRASAAPPSR